jgi:hypothetical protein
MRKACVYLRFGESVAPRPGFDGDKRTTKSTRPIEVALAPLRTTCNAAAQDEEGRVRYCVIEQVRTCEANSFTSSNRSTEKVISMKERMLITEL